MPVEALEFMAVAKVMMEGDDSSEIELRCAGSRAYYSLYHTALEVIARKGKPLIKVDKAGDHASVIATLCSMGHSAKSIGEAMGTLKRFRNDCDYDLALRISPKKTAMNVVQAQVLIDKLSRL